MPVERRNSRGCFLPGSTSKDVSARVSACDPWGFGGIWCSRCLILQIPLSRSSLNLCELLNWFLMDINWSWDIEWIERSLEIRKIISIVSDNFPIIVHFAAALARARGYLAEIASPPGILKTTPLLCAREDPRTRKSSTQDYLTSTSNTTARNDCEDIPICHSCFRARSLQLRLAVSGEWEITSYNLLNRISTEEQLKVLNIRVNPCLIDSTS